MLPNAYQIARKWNISDYDKRVKDGSLTYDYFNVSEGKIEYCISKCVYIEMFEQYGIRSLCKIFCMTDTTSYENLPKHVRFIRYSDLWTIETLLISYKLRNNLFFIGIFPPFFLCYMIFLMKIPINHINISNL